MVDSLAAILALFIFYLFIGLSSRVAWEVDGSRGFYLFIAMTAFLTHPALVRIFEMNANSGS